METKSIKKIKKIYSKNKNVIDEFLTNIINEYIEDMLLTDEDDDVLKIKQKIAGVKNVFEELKKIDNIE